MWKLFFSVCIWNPESNACFENNILKEEQFQKQIVLETESNTKGGCYSQAQPMISRWLNQQGIEWHIVNFKCYGEEEANVK